MSKKIVVKLDLHDNKDKQKAMKAVAALVGIDAISMDMASQKMTVIGTVDPVAVVSRLRKQAWAAHIDSVGPAKEPKKKEEKKDEAKEEEGKKDEPKKDDDAKKDDGKKDDGKKDEAKKDDGGGEKKPAPVPPPPPQPTPEQQHQKMITELINQQYKAYNPYMTTHYSVRSMEENPNSCVIC